MDTNLEAEVRPAIESYEGLASLLEQHLLDPGLPEDRIRDGCRMAVAFGLAAVVVRPCDVDVAARLLESSAVRLASVAGFPHGTANTATKLYEGRDLLRRGAKEIALAVNPAQMLARQFQHVETEILQMSESCHQAGAVLKVIYETGYLAEDLKIILSKMCKRTEADFAETSTGYGPPSNLLDDIASMKRILRDVVRIKATDAKSLGESMEFYHAGCDRIGTTNAEEICQQWRRTLTERAKQAQ